MSKPSRLAFHVMIEKAGFVDLTDDDRATPYGTMFDQVAKARDDGDALTLWKRRGKWVFDAEAGGAA